VRAGSRHPWNQGSERKISSRVSPLPGRILSILLLHTFKQKINRPVKPGSSFTLYGAILSIGLKYIVSVFGFCNWNTIASKSTVLYASQRRDAYTEKRMK
jgi:hypothetical protein